MTIVASTDDLKRLSRDLSGIYAKLERAVRVDDEYYKLAFKELLDLPDEFIDQGVVLPTAREVVDTAAAHIEPQFRRINVPRRNEDDSGTEQAVKLRSFYEALLRYFERRTSPSPFRDSAKHISLYGMSCLKLLYDRTKAPKRPIQGSQETPQAFAKRMSDWEVNRTWVMPFTLNVIHPAQIMPDPWHDTPEWAIEKRTIKTGQLEADYPDWPNPMRKLPTTDVVVWEYWDASKRVIIADGRSVFFDKDGNEEEFREHDMGVHPYIFGASGLGHIDVDRAPEHVYVGMLRFIRQILQSESRQYSIADIVLKAGAWPQRVLVGDRAAEVGEDVLDMDYGTLKPLPEGVSIETLTPEIPDQMVFNFLGLSSNIISQATAPRVLTGGRVPGTASGFDNQITLNQARIRYKPLASAMEKMLTEVCMKAGIMMEKLKVPALTISVGTVEDKFMKVGGSDWKGHRAVEVLINVLEAEDEIRKNQNLIQMVQARLKSPTQAIAEANPGRTPQQVERELLKSDIVNAIVPFIAQGIGMEAAQRLELDSLLEGILDQTEGATGTRTPENLPSSEDTGEGSRPDQARQRQVDLRNNGVNR